MRVFLVRHGETNWNRVNRVQGNSNEPLLTRIGEQQAFSVGRVLKDQYNIGVNPEDQLFSSPLIRAIDTAVQMILSGDLVFQTQEVIPELTERDAGDFTGFIKPKNGIIEGMKDNSETNEALLIRTGIAWEKIKNYPRKDSDVNIVIVGHLGSNRALVANILGHQDISRSIKQNNAAISIYDVPPIGPVQIITENDTSHLGGMITESIADL